MTKPNGYRYAIMACYKKSGNDSIGYCSWPWHHNKPWNIKEYDKNGNVSCNYKNGLKRNSK